VIFNGSAVENGRDEDFDLKRKVSRITGLEDFGEEV
jgi:hypothetical protein